MTSFPNVVLSLNDLSGGIFSSRLENLLRRAASSHSLTQQASQSSEHVFNLNSVLPFLQNVFSHAFLTLTTKGVK